MAGWKASSRESAPTVATIGGFGGFLTGAAMGFSFSVNRFRVTSLQLKMPYDSFSFWTPTDNLPKLQELMNGYES